MSKIHSDANHFRGKMPPCGVDRSGPSGIMMGLIAKEFIMEAERLNSLSALLADLTTREAELRRYL
jgi:hypothetical protein